LHPLSTGGSPSDLGPTLLASKYMLLLTIPPMGLTQQIAKSGRQLHAHQALAPASCKYAPLSSTRIKQLSG